MNQTLKLPVGIENFEDIRKLGFYYIDKTKLIEQLLQNWGKVNLFTRPRRFGKTLNMSMLRTFFLKLVWINHFLKAYIFLKIKNYVMNIWVSIQ
mgnify:CR=1 FL=1